MALCFGFRAKGRSGETEFVGEKEEVWSVHVKRKGKYVEWKDVYR
jgi:hypothetical protein